ncbi:hypothetical protein QFZ82_004699 [Streptomyces sp. V4I23]|uniref:hypothetical protein n=1 Tax=Streptomyces sp. V4I23 TaxID=3042282 RepID=UPI0027876C49|nr:hypothetical protein [Streptomyces sp. V4I23]MDQ1010214.1 hypothetical protein [Streptomyces sp. V4I23]
MSEANQGAGSPDLNHAGDSPHANDPPGAADGSSGTGPAGRADASGPSRPPGPPARLAPASTVVVGQLWGLSVVVNEWMKNEWMKGETGTAWGVGLLALSYVVVLALWSLDPGDR